MTINIIEEYKELLISYTDITKKLNVLPRGYVSKKVISGKIYHYLQTRVDGKLQSKYIKRNELSAVTNGVERSKVYKMKLPIMEKRFDDIEKAAKLMDKAVYREIILLKVSAGLDTLSEKQKENSMEFANSMNAIEGVHISHETEDNILKWKNGTLDFVSLFHSTLSMYGFNTEVGNA